MDRDNSYITSENKDGPLLLKFQSPSCILDFFFLIILIFYVIVWQQPA